MNKIMIVIASCLLLAACGTQPVTPSSGHLRDEPRPAGNIPQPVQQAAPLPPPKATPKAETYSVTVNNVAVQELLFALGHIGNFIIERQDRRIVVTHQPSRSDLHGGEKLVQGDGPVIEYRKIRERLIREAAVSRHEQ